MPLLQSRQRPAPNKNPLNFSLLVLYVSFGFANVSAVLRARHYCIPEASVARVVGHHPDCVVLVDGPTCTEATVRDGGCKDTRVRNFTSCGELLYNEVDDPEPPANATNGGRTLSHCAYSARPVGSPCDPGVGRPSPKPSTPSPTTASQASLTSHAPTADGGASRGAAAWASSASAEDSGAPSPPSYVCGGGTLRGMCVPAGAHAAEHDQCLEFVCEKGLCEQPVPTNEGGACMPPGSAPPPPCQRRACRSGRCVVEALPDDQPCGPTGPCAEHLCLAGACVRHVEDDGVMCGRSTACADQVCIGGDCVEERRADGKLCGHSPDGCPRMCAAGKCSDCTCGPAFAFWAGRQSLPGFQWTPFLTDMQENSFGGYFNLQAAQLSIPPVKLPFDGSAEAAQHAADSAIVVCSGCRLGMQLQPGNNLVQGGALLAGSVGLAASPVRGGTYVSLDVVMFPNVTHHHLVVGWHPWAALSPPPLNMPHRWGDLSGPSPPTSPVPGFDPEHQVPGLLPRPTRHHSAWAFVRRKPVHWAFTAYEQVRSLFVGLHLTVASCSKAPPLSAAKPTAQPTSAPSPQSTTTASSNASTTSKAGGPSSSRDTAAASATSGSAPAAATAPGSPTAKGRAGGKDVGGEAGGRERGGGAVG